MLIEEPVINTGTADQDLAMQIRSINNTECTVDPLNKWCAYAEHLNDV